MPSCMIWTFIHLLVFLYPILSAVIQQCTTDKLLIRGPQLFKDVNQTLQQISLGDIFNKHITHLLFSFPSSVMLTGLFLINDKYQEVRIFIEIITVDLYICIHNLKCVAMTILEANLAALIGRGYPNIPVLDRQPCHG